MVNRTNYLLVKAHLEYLTEVMQVSKASMERYWFYLRHLLIWAGDIHLSKAPKIKPPFPNYVAALPGRRGDANLSAESRKKIIESARRFFSWAVSENMDGFASLPKSWIETLHPPRITRNASEHEYVTLEEAMRLSTMPVDETDLALRRDQAAAAMLFLSGIRGGAFTSLPIRAVNLTDRTIYQWPEWGVKTKNGKKGTTFLLPVKELLGVASQWDGYVRSNLPDSSLWYAPIDSQWGEQSLSTAVPGKNRVQALGRRIHHLFDYAGLPAKSPHKFRHGHAVYGLQHAQSMADYKALSMNLMHEDIKTTDQIYAPIRSEEVKNRISKFFVQQPGQPDSDLGDVLSRISNAELAQLMVLAAQRLSE